MIKAGSRVDRSMANEKACTIHNPECTKKSHMSKIIWSNDRIIYKPFVQLEGFFNDSESEGRDYWMRSCCTLQSFFFCSAYCLV